MQNAVNNAVDKLNNDEIKITVVNTVRNPIMSKKIHFDVIKNEIIKQKIILPSEINDVSILSGSLKDLPSLLNSGQFALINATPSGIEANSGKIYKILAKSDFLVEFPGAQPPFVKPGFFTRTSNTLEWSNLLVIDADGNKNTPPEFLFNNAEALLDKLSLVFPDFAEISYVQSYSSGSGLISPTGEMLTGLNCFHTYIAIEDATDLPRFIEELSHRLTDAGLTYLIPGETTPRHFIDFSVYKVTQPIFENKPLLLNGLTQQKPTVAYFKRKNLVLDTSKMVSATKSLPSIVKNGGKFQHDFNSLTLDTIIKLDTNQTVSAGVLIEHARSQSIEKFPCFSPFRDDNGAGCFISINDQGATLVDASTRTVFFLSNQEYSKKEKAIEGEVLPQDTGNFQLEAAGLFYKSEQVCGPIQILAQTHDSDDSNYGYLVEYQSKYGVTKKEIFSADGLVDEKLLLSHLKKNGLFVAYKKEKLLFEFLNNNVPSHWVQTSSQLGWADGKFTFPQKIFSHNRTAETMFQTSEKSARAIGSNGTLAEWKMHIAGKMQGNPLGIFLLSHGLSSALLEFTNVGTTFFHLHGESTHGKTTMAQIVASLYGVGAEPSADKKSVITTWNNTANALESICASYNSFPLILDEMGQSNVKNTGKLIYDVSSGEGKGVCKIDRSMREKRSWKLNVISTGEISSEEKIRSENLQIMPGHSVRCVDFSINNYPIFPNTHGLSPADFSQLLKINSGTFYGTAYPAFIEGLLSKTESSAELENLIRTIFFDIKNEFHAEFKMSPLQQRAVERWALSLAAGHLAAEFGILPFKKDDITTAVKAVIQHWLSNATQVKSSAVHGIEFLKSFIEQNSIRFYSEPVKNTLFTGASVFKPPINQVGYFVKYNHNEKAHFPAGGYYLFFKNSFKQILSNFDAASILSTLHQSGLLIRTRKNGTENATSHSVTTPSGACSLDFYAVSSDILKYGESPQEQNQGHDEDRVRQIYAENGWHYEENELFSIV
jgi:putative DNA primase/helicase